MITRTIERMRSARAWILDPTRLIDRLLDALEELSAVLRAPVRSAALAHSEPPIEAHLDLRL